MTSPTIDPARELAAFLRTRRERLDPRDAGLSVRRQARRTPGLRREEVAELAGISIDYLVRLEQARPLRPSVDVVEALARALRLAPDERTYLYDLTQQRPRTTAEPRTTAAAPLTRLLADLSPLPAMLMNHRYDILAWNPEMTKLLIDFEALPPQQRNSMWLCLIHPEIREYYTDPERVAREGIAYLRAAWAAYPEDQVLNELITQCVTRNERFARLWAERDVKTNGRGHKVIRHPDAGDIAVQFEVLMPLQDPDQRLMICRAADDDSQAAMDRLLTR
ncbi:helix-turn-helix transcriptional regulator [Streptomyces tsukubensis]|uniref:Transcriptional regulator n=1 Tax=Streptomyces tsukubensis TaxID=83656 RepID=A0A1V4AAJ1_9ACTN|nr:helix-turn-helix transcriptional regulator [Streptomyces tsukubensis]OON80129.1 transcriptional regulator [Streptomyces tsukubensis]QFR97359.1 helix-turn-helix domain-containing protein [Streptomyces tsukubensis]